MLNINDLINNLDLWLNEQRLDNELSINTIKTYRNSINKFIDYLNTNNIYDINKQIMLDYKDFLNNISKSYKSKNLWIISLNKYLKYLNSNELSLKQIKVQNKFVLQSNLNISDYKRLLRFSKKDNLTQDYLITKTLFATGIRYSELEFFTVENLRIENQGIINIYSKNKVRDVIIPTNLAVELRKYCRNNKINSGYIFRQIKDSSKLYSSVTYWKHLKKIAGMARVNKNKCHAHNLRHLFSVEFLKIHNNNYLALSDILGHSSLNTTRIYSTLSHKEKRAMLDAMKL